MMTDERGAGLLEADNGRWKWESLLSTVLEWLVRQMAPWPCVFRCIRRGVTGTSVTCCTAAWQRMTIDYTYSLGFGVADQLFERVG